MSRPHSYRKIILVTVLVITTGLPLLFLRLNEPTVTLAIAKVLAKTGSLAGVLLLFWQLILGFRGWASKFVPDYIWVIDLHKRLGKLAGLLILLHPVFITVYYARKYDRNLLFLEGDAAFRWYVVCGIVALAVLAAVVVSSAFFRASLARNRWYQLHLCSYLILPLVFYHSFPIGMTLRETRLGVVWSVLLGLLAVLYVLRLLHGLGWFSRKYVVTEAHVVAAGVTEIRMRPVGNGITPDFSQFAFMRRGLRSSSRPFTVSSFDPSSRELAVTVSAAGKTTQELQKVRPGEVMYLDGPYGTFGLEALASDKPIVMIAGGIGITAFKRMVEELAQHPEREAHLFYGNKSEAETAYMDEFSTLPHVDVVFVMSDQPSFGGETGFISLDMLNKYLKRPLADYEYLICGPPVMIEKLHAALRDAQVPAVQVHHELFGY